MNASRVDTFFTIKPHDRIIAYYAAMAIGLSLIDLSIPTPIPGIKPGLANIAILVCLMRFGIKSAVTVTFLRVLVTGLLLGTLFGPTFWLSLSGGLFSAFTLALCTYLPSRYFSVVSYSIVAAFAHISAQIVVVGLCLLPLSTLYKIIPVFALFALITGTINGLAALLIVKKYAPQN